MFPALRSIPSCTTDMNLRSCILNRHKMRQSQIATIQESLPSHFLICRILWSWPWRHKLSPITLKTCFGYLGEYPCSLLTWIWNVAFLPILALFHCYIWLCVCISYISYKAHNRFAKETLLIVSDVDVYMFPALRSKPSCTTDMNLRSCILNRHKMRQSQIPTIQESLPSHFVICRILWSWPWRQKLSPITLKTCFGYLGEYPCSLLTWIWNVAFLPILALFHCYIWLCVCISYISYKAHNRFAKETLLIVSDVDVYMFPALRSKPSCTKDMNLRSCILNRHKMRQSQIATIQESLPSHFVICRILWSWPWRHKLSPITLKTCSGYLGEYPCSLFDMNTKSFIFAHFGVISLLYLIVCMYNSYKAHHRFAKETLLIVSDVDVYMFPALRSIPSCTTDMNMRSCILNRHKMRQSQIATIQESLPSHFLICRILWSWPWRHKLSPITLKTCSGYLGVYPCSLLTWIPKVSFLPILALFHCYIWLCVCISVIKPIIDLQRKPYW